MAFQILNASEIASGEPTKTELFTKIKNDLDDHETRISDVEAFVASPVPFVFQVDGQGVVGDNKDSMRVPFGIIITGVKLFVKGAGSSGTLSIDVQRKVGAGAYASVLSSNVTAVYTSGGPFVASDAGISISTIPAGAFLRLDIDAVQIGCSGFNVEIEYTVNV